LHNHDDEDFPLLLTPWDVLAVSAKLFVDIFTAFALFMDAIMHMFINKADVVDSQKAFHDDVTRTIETIIEGE